MVTTMSKTTVNLLLCTSLIALNSCGGNPSSGSSSSSSVAVSSSSSVVASSSSSSTSTVNPCSPNDATPPPKTVSRTNQGTKPTGNYTVTIEDDPTLGGHTVYRPNLSGSELLPIVAWGTGGCSANGLGQAEFLTEIASHGYLVISNGAPNGSGSDPDDGSALISAIDWAEDENNRACSQYYGKLHVDNAAVMGFSCGGLMSINAGGDPRLSTVVLMNSGLLSPNQNVYNALHTPVAIFDGGPTDIAYENGARDFQNINNVPIIFANLPVGHGATYNDDNGGEFARVGVAWLNWHLKGDESNQGKGMFFGANCGICNSEWVIEQKNFE